MQAIFIILIIGIIYLLSTSEKIKEVFKFKEEIKRPLIPKKEEFHGVKDVSLPLGKLITNRNQINSNSAAHVYNLEIISKFDKLFSYALEEIKNCSQLNILQAYASAQILISKNAADTVSGTLPNASIIQSMVKYKNYPSQFQANVLDNNSLSHFQTKYNNLIVNAQKRILVLSSKGFYTGGIGNI